MSEWWVDQDQDDSWWQQQEEQQQQLDKAMECPVNLDKKPKDCDRKTSE